jgi:hypothetical protein
LYRGKRRNHHERAWKLWKWKIWKHEFREGKKEIGNDLETSLETNTKAPWWGDKIKWNISIVAIERSRIIRTSKITRSRIKVKKRRKENWRRSKEIAIKILRRAEKAIFRIRTR